MKTLFKLNLATCIAFAGGVALFLSSIFFQFNIFEVVIHVIKNIKYLEIDGIIIPLLFVIMGIIIDFRRASVRKQKLFLIKNIRLETLKATMRTVQSVIGHSMNTLILYKMESEESEALSEESLQDIETLIYKTTEELTALANVEDVSEKEMGHGLYGVDMALKESQ